MHFKGFQLKSTTSKSTDMTFCKTHSELKYKSEDTVSQSRSAWSLRQNFLREGELMLTDGINTILKEKDKEQVRQSTGQSKLFFRASY